MIRFLGLSPVWFFHNLMVRCSTWVFTLTRLLWNITTFMIRFFIPLFCGEWPIRVILIWEVLGLSPVWFFHKIRAHCSTWVFSLTGMLWNITTFRLASKEVFSCALFSHYSMGSAKVTHFLSYHLFNYILSGNLLNWVNPQAKFQVWVMVTSFGFLYEGY